MFCHACKVPYHLYIYMQARIGMHLLERTDAVERFALDTAELALVVAEMTYARNTAKGHC